MPYKNLIIYFLLLLLISCIGKQEKEKDLNRSRSHPMEKFKILYVDSYNTDYIWSRRILEGLTASLDISLGDDGVPLDGNDSIRLKIFHMDTKKNTSDEYKKLAAQNAYEIIESWKPDLVICSDDNAARYLIVPYYLGAELPFVFCGINHDASEYGFTSSNITGMVEIHNAAALVDQLSDFAQGDEIAYLCGDNYSGRKTGISIQEQLGQEITQIYVNSYEEWKEQYEDLQDSTDILLLETAQYFTDWDGNMLALESFVSDVTRIPTGAWDDSLITVALITMERMGEEHGEWAGKTALTVLNNVLEIHEVPIVKSKRTAVYLNMKLARDLGLQFPPHLFEFAHLTNDLAEMRRVLFINSYHMGKEWSHEIETRVLRVLDRSKQKIDLKVVGMNSISDNSFDAVFNKSLEIKELINDWEPEVVISSYTDFSKHIITPYFEDDLPFLLFEINQDALVNDCFDSNVTGMVEVDKIQDTLDISHCIYNKAAIWNGVLE